jgi:hypothetical protein
LAPSRCAGSTLDAAVGDYVVGFIVEDLDGNSQATYTTITVQ